MLKNIFKDKTLLLKIIISIVSLTILLITTFLLNYDGTMIYKETTDFITEYGGFEKFIRFTHMIATPLLLILWTASLFFYKKKWFIYVSLTILVFASVLLSISLQIYNPNTF